jgi:catechol 2,3-dioxygenase-like lactoylglutathione lyase family enzyme
MTAVQPKSFHHVGLSVPDLNAALDFYVGTLGFELLNRADWSGSPEIDMAIGADGSAGEFAMISLNGVCIEVFAFETPAATTPSEPRVVGHGWTHICVKVDDARATTSALKKTGVKFHAEPVDIGDGPFAYARDPFGNIIEIWQDET